MKKLIATILTGALVLSLTACSAGTKAPEEAAKATDTEGAAYLKDFDPAAYVVPGNYLDLTLTTVLEEVTDEQVEQYLNYLPAYYSTSEEITGRAAMEGDIADIKFVGKIDGEEFEGGSSDSYPLTLGSHSFIDGFEEGVVGMEVGETKDLNLKFPEDYGSTDLAGKDVVFTVTLNGLSQSVIPELNDEFAKSIDPDCNSIDELKVKIREELEEEAYDTYEANIYNEIESKIEESSVFKDMPTAYVDRMAQTMLASLEESAAQNGTDPGTIASYYYGVDAENYVEGIHDYCNDMAKKYVLLGAIANIVGITVTDEELDAALMSDLENAGSEYTLEEYKSMLGDIESYKEYVLITKTMDYIAEKVLEK